MGERLYWLQDELLGKREDQVNLPGGAEEALQRAEHAITVNRSYWERVASWWSGWDAERGWRAVHQAEVTLVADSADLASRLAGITELVAKRLPATDRRLRALEQVDTKRLEQCSEHPKHSNSDGRPVVAEAMRAAFAEIDDALRRVRILRNQMLTFGALLAALNVLIGVLASNHPNLLPLCANNVCPSGASHATGADVWTVQLFGMLGAAVAVVLLLANSPPNLATYSVTGYQSLVKITLGATLAIVGILILTVGSFETWTSSQPALLVAALVLGYSQQVATRFLDSTAQRLVSKAKTGKTDQS